VQVVETIDFYENRVITDHWIDPNDLDHKFKIGYGIYCITPIQGKVGFCILQQYRVGIAFSFLLKRSSPKEKTI
jgi:hypothetical protein